jgi:hypothetical protein
VINQVYHQGDFCNFSVGRKQDCQPMSPAALPADPAGSTQAQEVISRFHLATRYVQRMKDVGKNELFTLTMCPEKYSIGSRTTPGQARRCTSTRLCSLESIVIMSTMVLFCLNAATSRPDHTVQVIPEYVGNTCEV